MNIHCFQHAPFEGLGKIEEWIHEQGHTLTTTHFHLGEEPPALDSVDWLIVLGGAMNVYEYRAYPWLREEKRFLEKAIETGRAVLGICLGAQLIADVLGAKVYQNREIEIGWWPVRFHESAATIAAFKKFPRELTPLHWHGDTFDLPPGALAIAESDGCKHQAFALGENIVGLQFHIEVRHEEITAFVEDCRESESKFVQTREQILGGESHLSEIHGALRHLLESLAQSIAPKKSEA